MWYNGKNWKLCKKGKVSFTLKSRYIEDYELVALKEAFDNPSLYLPFEVALSTGLRIGDVLKIRKEDIRDGRLYYVAEKTGKSGCVALTSELADKLIKNANKSVWCFPSPKKRGKHLTRQAAWSRLKNVAKKLGSEANVVSDGISPHSYRKTFAVDLFKREGITAVMSALQHSNIQTTELYALSDFISGANAEKPLLRKDIPYIVARVIEFLNR